MRCQVIPHFNRRKRLCRQVQTLLGHERLETTQIYTHVVNKPASTVTSPLDRLAGKQAALPASFA